MQRFTGLATRATLDIQVQREGAPMPGVIGLSIVDESVFSVREQEPGFARTYFLLERELQEPRYEIHDFVPMEDDTYSPYDDRPDSVKYALQSGQEMSAQMEMARQVALTGYFAKTLADEEVAVQAPAEPVSAPSPFSPLAFWWGNRIFLLAPLIGLALYNGTRKRRNLLIALIVLALGAFVWSACGAPAAPAAAPASRLPPRRRPGPPRPPRAKKRPACASTSRRPCSGCLS